MLNTLARSSSRFEDGEGCRVHNQPQDVCSLSPAKRCTALRLDDCPKSQVKRCDEMARRLRFFTEQVEKAGLTPTVSAPSGKHELDDLESRLEELEKELISMNENTERLDRTYNELVELQVRPAGTACMHYATSDGSSHSGGP